MRSEKARWSRRETFPLQKEIWRGGSAERPGIGKVGHVRARVLDSSFSWTSSSRSVEVTYGTPVGFV